MKKSSKIRLATALGLAVVLAVFLFLRQPGPPDAVQIQAQIAAAEAAASQRNASGVMRIVSGEYKDGHLNGDQLRLLLIRAFRDSGPIQVTVSPARIHVEGESADSTSTITVRSGDNSQAAFNKAVTLHWRREEGRRLLVFPAHVWRVVGADYEGSLTGGEDDGLL